MNNISVFSKCANCGACYNKCPTGAISINDNIFYDLKIDESKCIRCGLCITVCPVNSIEERQNLIGAYAGYNNNIQIVKNSSSGGAFAAIADFVIKKGGIVFGAAYTDDCRVVQIKSTDETNLENLMRSKYVESKVENSFKTLKEQLVNGRTVFFCGAPCQVAGLKRFLGENYENLITCDFSCGGMSSHKYYKEYLDYIEKEIGASIDKVNFRPKLYGWLRHSIKITGKNGKDYKNFAFNDPYFYSFIGNGFNKREYCVECNFSNNHYSDIILADFWAYSKVSKIKNDDTGLSLIITNSQKGEAIIEKIRKNFVLTVLDVDKASYNMKSREPSVEFLNKRLEFINNCEQNGFIQTMKKIKMESKFLLRMRYLIGKIKRILG